MRPQHKPTGQTLPGGDVTTAQGWPRTCALMIEQEQIVRASFYAELRRPAVADSREFGAKAPADPLHSGCENPRAVAFELALRHRRTGVLWAKCGARGFRARGIGARGDQCHGIDRGAECVGDLIRQWCGAFE